MITFVSHSSFKKWKHLVLAYSQKESPWTPITTATWKPYDQQTAQLLKETLATKAATALSAHRRMFIFKQTVGINKSSKIKSATNRDNSPLGSHTEKSTTVWYCTEYLLSAIPTDASVTCFSEGSSPGGLKKTGIMLPVSGCTLALEEEKKKLDHLFHT